MDFEGTLYYKIMYTNISNVKHGGVEVLKYSSRGAQIPGARSPVRLSFCTVAPNIFGSSVWNLLHVTLPAPRILRWLLVFFLEHLLTPAFIAGDMR
jgi:hypothetical protein